MNYQKMLEKLKTYEKKYLVKTIGFTEFNRKIIAVEITKNEQFSTAILIAGVHARENITCDLVCEMLDLGLFDKIQNFNVSVIIMANPDGIELSNFGLISVLENIRENLLKINNGDFDFSLWKANGRGVDINNNFDANFGTNTSKTSFASSGYVGEFAESELETRALKNYIINKKTFFTISYHSKGEEIYYNFFQSGKRLERDKIIAEKFASSTGYIIKNVENSSSGGLKDYCVYKLKIPSITIEVGSDDLAHPIKEEYLKEIFEKHKNIANDLEFTYNTFIEYQDL